MDEMTAEEFLAKFGYYPGRTYEGGLIQEQVTRVDGDYIVVTTSTELRKYHTQHYHMRSQ